MGVGRIKRAGVVWGPRRLLDYVDWKRLCMNVKALYMIVEIYARLNGIFPRNNSCTSEMHVDAVRGLVAESSTCRGPLTREMPCRDSHVLLK